MRKLIDVDRLYNLLDDLKLGKDCCDDMYKIGYNIALCDVRGFATKEPKLNDADRMDAKRAIEVMTTEMKCILRSDTCNHDCKSCLLVLPDELLLNAYCVAIQALARLLKEEGEENRKE